MEVGIRQRKRSVEFRLKRDERRRVVRIDQLMANGRWTKVAEVEPGKLRLAINKGSRNGTVVLPNVSVCIDGFGQRVVHLCETREESAAYAEAMRAPFPDHAGPKDDREAVHHLDSHELEAVALFKDWLLSRKRPA